MRWLLLSVALLMAACPDFNSLDRCEREVCAPTCAVQVAAGWAHTCVRKADGSVWCWGVNNAGQLGTGETEDEVAHRPTPTQLPSLHGVVDVASGDSHSCAVLDGGSVMCWGYNEYGQLGAGSTLKYSPTPLPVTGLTDARRIFAGGYSTCALRTSGDVSCWGANDLKQLGNASAGASARVPVASAMGLGPVVELSMGLSHVCAVDAQAQVSCWGDNTEGQFGNGTDGGVSAIAQRAVSEGQHVAGALNTTCVTHRDGTVWCWGQNNLGQLGDGETVSQTTPVQASALEQVVQLAGGGDDQIGPLSHLCARGQSGAMWCWGSNLSGEIGNNTASSSGVPTPTLVPSLPDAFDISVGVKHSCAVRRNGTVWCWGANENGQLGDSTFLDRHVPSLSTLPCL